MRYEVRYDILVEPRTDTFLGASRSDLQCITVTVEAANPGQATAIVENQNGGRSRCLVHGARPLY